MYVVIAENDESQWDDKTGQQYHFPRQYLKLLKKGTNVVYYKGLLKNSKYKDARLTTKPHYFGVGVVGEVTEDANSSKKDYFCKILDFIPFNTPVLAKNASGEFLEKIPDNRIGNYWRNGVRLIDIEVFNLIVNEAEITPFELATVTEQLFYEEGERKQRISTYYERNPLLRKQVLSQHTNISCEACSFDFERTYGKVGTGYIHVHHLRPVSVTGITKPDPKSDFALLCPNCHAMVHREAGKVLSIEELRKIIDSNRDRY